jgi:hypothetical protein
MLPVQIEGETVATNVTVLPEIDGFGPDQMVICVVWTL